MSISTFFWSFDWSIAATYKREKFDDWFRSSTAVLIPRTYTQIECCELSFPFFLPVASGKIMQPTDCIALLNSARKKNRVYNRQIAYRLHKKRMADSSIWYNVFMLFFHSRFFSRPLNSIAVKVCNIVSVSSMYDILSRCLCVFVWVWGSVWMEFLYGQQILCIISFSSSLPYLMSVAQVSRASGAADTPNNVRNER